MFHDPFGRSAIPASIDELRLELTREESVRRLLKVAQRLTQSADVDDAQVGTGLLDWLADGGDLRKRLGVGGRRGSHRTARAIANSFAHKHDDSSAAADIPCEFESNEPDA